MSSRLLRQTSATARYATLLCSSVLDAELIVAAAEAGAAVVRARYGTPLARIDKAPGDFATEADIESEHAIMNVLRGARPTDGLIGEEAGAAGPASATRTWLIDPLCGTLNYAAQTPFVAVNFALRNGDHITVAACADPLAGELFWTDGHRGLRAPRWRRRTAHPVGSHIPRRCQPGRPLSERRPVPRGTSIGRSKVRVVPAESVVHHPRPRLGRCRPPCRVSNRRTPPQQRPLRNRHRAVPGSRLRRDRAARTATSHRCRRPGRRRRPTDPRCSHRDHRPAVREAHRDYCKSNSLKVKLCQLLDARQAVRCIRILGSWLPVAQWAMERERFE